MKKVEKILKELNDCSDKELFELLREFKFGGRVIIPGFYTKTLAEQQLDAKIDKKEMAFLAEWMDEIDFAFRDPLTDLHNEYLTTLKLLRKVSKKRKAC